MTQNAGITPDTLYHALRQYQHEFPGVLEFDAIGLYDSGQEWEGVIVHMPEHSWVIGIHGDDPAWDSTGYLDWSMYTTGRDTRHLYLDEYIGMGVANDSKGWSLDQMVAKIVQVVRDRELTDGNECMSGPDGIHACYANGNECHCPCVHCDSEAI